jgi:DNA repair protein RecO (recombination protein O)
LVFEVRNYKIDGIILKRSNLQEADRLLTIFSKEKGKIKVIAKGARRITSHKGGSIELFNHVRLNIVLGKNLDIVSEVEVIDSFSEWRKEIKKVGLAYYFCELVDKLTAEEQEHEAVFHLLVDALTRLDQGKYLSLVVEFEKSLLIELGFGIPKELENSKASLKDYIEKITEKRINSPKVIKEIWS